MFKELLEALVRYLVQWLTHCFKRDVKERLDSSPVAGRNGNAANDNNSPNHSNKNLLPHGNKRKLILRDPHCPIHGKEVQRKRDEEEERIFHERLSTYDGLFHERLAAYNRNGPSPAEPDVSENNTQDEDYRNSQLAPETSSTSVPMAFPDGDSAGDPITWPVRTSSLQDLQQQIAAPYTA